MTKSSTLEALNQIKASPPYRPGLWLVAASCLLLITLACGIGQSGSDVVVLTRLPSLTPTPLPTLTPTVSALPAAVAMASEPAVPDPPPASPTMEAASIPSAADPAVEAVDTTTASNASPTATPADAFTPPPPPEATATFPPTPTIPPTATPTPIPGAADWLFAGMRVATDPDEGTVILYGDMINNTGAPQELSAVSSTFYDAQGQVIDSVGDAQYHWPIDAIPQGGRVPFELTVTGIQSAADFDLNVEAGPSRETPRQDFEFMEISQVNEADGYCVAGKLRNPGNELESFLAIVIVLYDSQEGIINFNDYYERSPEAVTGDRALDFKTCVDPLDQNVARHELRAWGL